MTRRLATYERGKDDVEDERIAKIMESEGCTAPVAKNLLKMGKLGISSSSCHWEESSGNLKKGLTVPTPPTPYQQKKQALLEAERKQRAQEEEDSDPDLGSFLGGKTRKVGGLSMFGSKGKKIGGIERLGPVESREEAVDPLLTEERQRKAEEDKKREEEEYKRAQNQREQDEQEGFDYDSLPTRFPTDREKERERDKKRAAQTQQQNEGKRRRKKKKRKRDRDEEDDEGEDEDEADHDYHRKAVEERDSPSPEPIQPSRGKMMTEEEVMKMMKHGKDRRRRANPEQAQERIKKELEEWELRKEENAEFWTAPRFALCYSAETSKNRAVPIKKR